MVDSLQGFSFDDHSPMGGALEECCRHSTAIDDVVGIIY